VEVNPGGEADGASTPDGPPTGEADGTGDGPRVGHVGDGAAGSAPAGGPEGSAAEGALPSGGDGRLPTRVTGGDGVPSSVRAYIRRYLESIRSTPSAGR
jgi:hypothetical protein